MLRSFTVKNFRCFKDLTLAPLERVNVIAGKNNVGKTALLEGLYLHSGPGLPRSPQAFEFLRCLERFSQAEEESWEWLFAGKEVEDVIEFQGATAGSARTLRIRLEDTAATDFPPRGNGPAAPGGAEARPTAGARQLVLSYEDRDGPGYQEVEVAVSGTGTVAVRRTPHARFPGSVLLGACAGSSSHDEERYSSLVEVGREAAVLPALQLLDPRLRRFAVLVAGGTPSLHADLGTGRLIPVRYLGEGLRRLLSVVLAIASTPGGLVLIDEVENGLHHAVLTKVWQALARAAREADVQVVATTQSYECIQAAHQASLESGCYDLRLFRLDRVDAEIRVAVYNQTTLETSVEMNLEVR